MVWYGMGDNRLQNYACGFILLSQNILIKYHTNIYRILENIDFLVLQPAGPCLVIAVFNLFIGQYKL